MLATLSGAAAARSIRERLPSLIRDWKLDLVVANGENAAGGFGITETIYRELIDVGIDAITLGNHAWDQKEALVFIERAPRLIRPINYPPGTPGRGAALVEAKNGARVLIVNAMARVFMDPLDDPFAAVDRELAACPLTARRRRRHHRLSRRGDERETGDGLFLRRSRHASWSAPTPMCRPPTIASFQVAPPYITDVGMTGDFDFIIGMAKEEPLQRFLRRISSARVRAGKRAGHACAAWRLKPIRPRVSRARVAAVRLGGVSGRIAAGILGLSR